MSALEKKSIEQKTLEGGKSYALISIVSQVISWVFTFLVIRLLSPEDYGLMALASVLTGFIQVFSGLGLGTGIVQKNNINDRVLSSIFWFSMAVGLLMSVVVFYLADINGWIFDNQEIVPVTRMISILFIISAFTTVPLNLMSRNYQFKEIALINMSASLIASISSVFFALSGFGVYTLILSSLILEFCKAIGCFMKSGWRPHFHFNFFEIKDFLSFGIYLSLSASFTRLIQTFDRVIIGKEFGVTVLGHYSTAMSISNMIIDKISPLISPIVFPLMSRLKDDKSKRKDIYLNLLTYYLMFIAPIYIGGIFVADELIFTLLGEKWMAILVMFKVFCWINIFKVLSSFHNLLIVSGGNSKRVMQFNLLVLFLLVGSIYICSLYGYEYIAYAWGITYPLTCLSWIMLTLKENEINSVSYIKALMVGLNSSFVMLITLLFLKYSINLEYLLGNSKPMLLTVYVLIAGLSYCLSLYFFQRDRLLEAINLLFKR
jgi:O-antigen/teichoic acid export membrane protein